MVTEPRRLQALEEFNRALAKRLPPSEVVRLAVEKALTGTGAEAAELFLVEEASRQSFLVCHRGLFPEAFHQIPRFPPGVGYPGLVAVQGEAIATEKLSQDPRYLRTQVKELGFSTYFCLPLLLGEQVLGCLNIAARHRGGITTAERQFLEGLGGGLSLALEAGRWRLAETLISQEKENGKETSLEEVVSRTLEAMAAAGNSSGAALFFASTPYTPYQLLATWGIWHKANLPSGELPQGCPALLSPRFSPCPEEGCPFAVGTGACYPLRGRGEVLGVLCLGYGEGQPLPGEAFSLIPVAALLALGLGRLRDHRLGQEQGAEEERRRLAREIHDGVVQSLGLLRVKAEYLSRLAGREPERLAEELRELRRLAGDSLEELRRTVYSLPPAELEPEGLVSSLHSLAQRMERAYRIPVKVVVHGTEEALNPSLQLHLLRLSQEALSNALRHSGARRVELELKLDASGRRLRVRDDGRGFDPEGAPWGLGLSIMKERARSLGGWLVIDSAPGQGTTLQIYLPGGR